MSASKLIKPNFFIVGAPKCGTTSLHHYLAQHPDIFLPGTKEPNYFCRDLDISVGWSVKSEQAYINLFTDAGCAKRVGEASVWYLFSRCAAAEIKAFVPDPKIIVMLRNPVDLMNSLHLEFINSDHEDILDFAKALGAESDRRAGRRISPHCKFAECILYREVATLTPQVKRFIDTFGPENVKVTLLDDMRQDISGLYRDVLRFLEVDPMFEADLQPMNTSRPLSRIDLWLKRQVYRHRWGARLWDLWCHMPGPGRAAYRFITSQLLPTTRTTTIDPELRHQLIEEFKPEMIQLGNLIQRDISSWYADASR